MKDKPKEVESSFYYIVCEEWLYPTESGRQLCEDWDTPEEALRQSRELAEAEESNFEKNCKVDPLPSTLAMDDSGAMGYLITPRNGLDDWYYIARVIKVKKIG